MSTTLPSDQPDTVLAQELPSSVVVIDLDVVATPDDDPELPAEPAREWTGVEPLPQRRWRGRADHLREALRQCAGTIADLARLALLPTVAGYGTVHLARQAAHPVLAPPATGSPHPLALAAHHFALAGKELLAAVLSSGLPQTLLTVMIVFGAMRGLLSAQAPLSAGIWWTARAVMPVFFFLVTVAVGAHLPVPVTVLVAPFVAYLAYVALIVRATRRPHRISEDGQS